MDSAKLGRRHLPVFEARTFHVFAEAAHHQGLIQFFLLGKARDVDRLETRQGLSSVLDPVGNRLV